jgi:predicted homoserine dehydrogenase-like protein
MGLSEDCTLEHDISKDQAITCEDVTMPDGRLCDRLRQEQTQHFFVS